MSLYRQNALNQANQADLLGELFDWIQSFPKGFSEQKRAEFLEKIGASLDFEESYIESSIKGDGN